MNAEIPLDWPIKITMALNEPAAARYPGEPVAATRCALLHLDWGHAGLLGTRHVLLRARLTIVGIRRDKRDTAAPVAVDLAGLGRGRVVACGSPSRSIPTAWVAAAWGGQS